MTRTFVTLNAAAAMVLLAGCGDTSRPLTSDYDPSTRSGYAASGTYRYDQHGNRVYDAYQNGSSDTSGRMPDGAGTRQADSFATTDASGMPQSRYGADGSPRNDRPAWDRDPAMRQLNDQPVYNRDVNDRAESYTGGQTSNGAANGRDRLMDHTAPRSPNWNGQGPYAGNSGAVRPGMNSGNQGGSTQQGGYGQMNPGNGRGWNDSAWNDRNVTRVAEADLPVPVRTVLTSESHGAAFSETGRGMWNGREAYSARITRNGHPYTIITDADGTLLLMRRLD